VCTYRVGPWQTGDVIAHDQGAWGDPASASTGLVANFNRVYGGLLEVGLIGSAGFSMSFTFNSTVLSYLPAVGFVGALSTDHLNPTSTESGLFGGEVTALRLNVDFSDAGITLGANEMPVGDLTICGFIPLPALNGLTVRQLLGIAETVLGGGSAITNVSQTTTITSFVNFSFNGGSPSTFAQDNLVTGACP
jgi:hypothetical protein